MELLFWVYRVTTHKAWIQRNAEGRYGLLFF
jgi:hypothetical protein